MIKLLEFLEARMKGASKIARQAELKGGPSDLTAWHFKAKLPEYREVISMVNSGKSSKEIKEYCRKRFRSLSHRMVSPNIDQKEFQQLAGQAEVFGEVYNKL